jgi:purine-binding chemotaxis protein CheW
MNPQDLNGDQSAARAILRKRAELLAKTPPAPPKGEVLQITTFSIGGNHYAVENCHLREVLRLSSLTRVPGTPSFVAGATHYHGSILAVFDLLAFFNVQRSGLPNLSWLMVLGNSSPEFGLLADEVNDVRSLSTAELHPTPDGLGEAAKYARGVTNNLMVMLDGSLLLKERRLFIHGESNGWSAGD